MRVAAVSLGVAAFVAAFLTGGVLLQFAGDSASSRTSGAPGTVAGRKR